MTQIAEAVRSALERVLIEEGYPNDPQRLRALIEVTPCGSYRRGKPSSGDVDVLITRRDGRAYSTLMQQVLQALEANGVEMRAAVLRRCQGGAGHGALWRGLLAPGARGPLAAVARPSPRSPAPPRCAQAPPLAAGQG